MGAETTRVVSCAFALSSSSPALSVTLNTTSTKLTFEKKHYRF